MAIARLLALLCCLNLALPPGWCSFAFPVRAAEHGGCCDLCGCEEREQPAPAPAPSQCCCYEQNWSKPPLPVIVEADQTTVAFDAIQVVPLLWFNLEFAIPVPSLPIHVLNCVWLC